MRENARSYSRKFDTNSWACTAPPPPFGHLINAPRQAARLVSGHKNIREEALGRPSRHAPDPDPARISLSARTIREPAPRAMHLFILLAPKSTPAGPPPPPGDHHVTEDRRPAPPTTEPLQNCPPIATSLAVAAAVAGWSRV